MTTPDVARLAETVRQVYDQAADDLLGLVAVQVASSIPLDDELPAPNVRDQAVAVARVAEGARRIVARLDRLAIPAGDKALTRAQAAGVRKAERELSALLGRAAGDYLRGERIGALARYAADLAGTQREAHRVILRQAPDAYRTVIARALAPKIAGSQSRRIDVAQAAMNEFSARGIAEFRDERGRRWELANYVEMATRTATARTMVEAQVERLASQGHDLFVVSDSPNECALCRPFEGRVVSRSGTTRTERRLSAIDDEMVDVEVMCSLPEAMARGLLHPNCTHGVALYVPGATQLAKPGTLASPKGYEAEQQQRALERSMRRARREHAAALTPAAKKSAAAKVKALNTELAAHVERHQLIRQKARERVGQGLAR